jgi:hypothetical protein
LPVPLGDYDLGNCNFRPANGFIEKGLRSRRRAPKRSIRSASNEPTWPGSLCALSAETDDWDAGVFSMAGSLLMPAREVLPLTGSSPATTVEVPWDARNQRRETSLRVRIFIIPL